LIAVDRKLYETTLLVCKDCKAVFDVVELKKDVSDDSILDFKV